MEISAHFIFVKKPPLLFFTKPIKALKPLCSLSQSSESRSSGLALSLQAKTLKVLEWSSLCNQLSPFTSTSMALSVTQSATVPIGQTLDESLKLLNQTAAALESGPVDFSGIEDITGIVNSAVSGKLLTVRELCSVRRTVKAARAVLERLKGGGGGGDHSERGA